MYRMHLLTIFLLGKTWNCLYHKLFVTIRYRLVNPRAIKGDLTIVSCYYVRSANFSSQIYYRSLLYIIFQLLLKKKHNCIIVKAVILLCVSRSKIFVY